MARTLTAAYSAAAFLVGVTTGFAIYNGRGHPDKTISADLTQPPAIQKIVALALNDSTRPKGFHTVIPVKRRASTVSGRATALPSVSSIPTWNYTVTASSDLGGGQFSGTIVGRSPFDRGKTTTTISTQIVPLVITITDGSGTKVYDPTAADACVGNRTGVGIITNSPIFTNNPWTMNGVNVGNTQYIDAFQRAEFNSLVNGSDYHVILNPSVLAGQALSFGTGGTSGPGSNFSPASTGGCEFVGVVNINDIDNAVQALISGPLAPMVNAGTFPIFLTKNVFFAISGNSLFSNCCALGYHSGLFDAGNNLQIYSPFSLDTSGIFGGDVSTLAHEMGEAINDPTGDNLTPVWGNIGQAVGQPQNNFEVGDPMSPGFGTPTKSFVVTGSDGFVYHLQEMAFFNWFFGGTSMGAGGLYSNNGSFKGNAILFSSGGGTH